MFQMMGVFAEFELAIIKSESVLGLPGPGAPIKLENAIRAALAEPAVPACARSLLGSRSIQAIG